jgi:hypothetical protein
MELPAIMRPNSSLVDGSDGFVPLSAFSQEQQHNNEVVESNETITTHATAAANTVAQQLTTSPTQSRLRTAILALLVALVITCVIDARTSKHIETFYTLFTEWLSTHPVSGILVVIIVYIVATILFIPGSVLTIGVGYAFQGAFRQSTALAVLFSSTAVFIGASLGSIACLLLGRYLFRDYVLQLANHYPIFRAVDRGTTWIPYVRCFCASSISNH